MYVSYKAHDIGNCYENFFWFTENKDWMKACDQENL